MGLTIAHQTSQDVLLDGSSVVLFVLLGLTTQAELPACQMFLADMFQFKHFYDLQGHV
jgi:hypothetical protein